MVPSIATRLAGSPELYQSSGREPFHSINFVTRHDGFTLSDLVSYEAKHNEANGETNADGSNDNWSWNCGVEGPVADAEIGSLRTRQIKNMAALLLLSHGTPMILAGDEFGRTQFGNNNAYCQDNATGWVDWRLQEENAALFRFFRGLIALRRHHSLLRRASFVPTADQAAAHIEWHGVELYQPDWSWTSHLIACHQYHSQCSPAAMQLYIIANAHWHEHSCALPVLRGGWHRLVDTALPAPDDVADPECPGTPEFRASYPVGPRSVVVLGGRT